MEGPRQVEVDGRSMGVQRVVDGTLLDVSDPAQVHAAGAALAALHLALARYPEVDRLTGRSGHDRPEPLEDRITGWVEAVGRDRPTAAVETLDDWLAPLRSDHDLPAQLVHNDFRSANVVWSGTGVAAVLDFENATLDYAVMDVAHAAVLLGTRFRNWGPPPPEAQEIFLAGYQAIRPLTPDEDAWLRPLILWRTLSFLPPGEDPAGWGRSVAHRLAAGPGPSRGPRGGGNPVQITEAPR